MIWLSLSLLLATFAGLWLLWWALRRWSEIRMAELHNELVRVNLNHSEKKMQTKIWASLVADRETAVAMTMDDHEPDVVVTPDEMYDDLERDENNVIYLDDDGDDAKFLMGVLNIDDAG